MQRTTAVAVIIVGALLSVAILVSSYMFTHRAEPEPSSAQQVQQALDRANAARVACLESGGTWNSLALAGQDPCQR